MFGASLVALKDIFLNLVISTMVMNSNNDRPTMYKFWFTYDLWKYMLKLDEHYHVISGANHSKLLTFTVLKKLAISWSFTPIKNSKLLLSLPMHQMPSINVSCWWFNAHMSNNVQLRGPELNSYRQKRTLCFWRALFSITSWWTKFWSSFFYVHEQQLNFLNLFWFIIFFLCII